MPTKLHELPPLLLREGLFDSLHFTEEDKKRTKLYQSENQRKSSRSAFGSIDEYLQSLQTVAVIHRARAAEIPRIAQLTQKTNQFNLTTRRYSEAEIQAFVGDPDTVVYSLAVRDRFGSLGLVGALIVRLNATTALIDTFLMSCRALGRRLEETMVDYCLAEIRAERHAAQWQAEYIPTAKNSQVADFWARLDFVASDRLDGRKLYVRAADAVVRRAPTYVTIDKD